METTYKEKSYGGILYDKDDCIVGYVGGSTMNGLVFRNDYADGDEICYIPEVSFDADKDYTLTEEDAEVNGYTFNELTDLVREKLERGGAEVSERNLEIVTRNVLFSLDWMCPETYLAEIDAEILAFGYEEEDVEDVCPCCGRPYEEED